MRHASHHVPFETEPNRDLKKGESAREDQWYEQPRITKLPTIHSDRADSGKVPGISYACLVMVFAWDNSPPIATTMRNIA